MERGSLLSGFSNVLMTLKKKNSTGTSGASRKDLMLNKGPKTKLPAPICSKKMDTLASEGWLIGLALALVALLYLWNSGAFFACVGAGVLRTK